MPVLIVALLLILVLSSENARGLATGLTVLAFALPIVVGLGCIAYVIASSLTAADWCLIAPVAALLALYIYRNG